MQRAIVRKMCGVDQLQSTATVFVENNHLVRELNVPRLGTRVSLENPLGVADHFEIGAVGNVAKKVRISQMITHLITRSDVMTEGASCQNSDWSTSCTFVDFALPSGRSSFSTGTAVLPHPIIGTESPHFIAYTGVT